jgi:hypothetical protein
MAKPSTPVKEKKGVAWYIPTPLRHWLNSHAEYLSAIGKETSTDAMVVEWLKERLKIEERKRDPRALERATETHHENRQGTVRRSPSSDAGKASAENRKDTR